MYSKLFYSEQFRHLMSSLWAYNLGLKCCNTPPPNQCCSEISRGNTEFGGRGLVLQQLVSKIVGTEGSPNSRGLNELNRPKMYKYNQNAESKFNAHTYFVFNI